MRSRRLATAAFGVVLMTWLAATWLALLSPTPGASSSWGVDGPLANLLFPLAMFTFPVVGMLIAWHEESNPIAWLLLGIGFVWALSGVTTGYTTYALKTHPGSVPGGALVAAIDGSLWVPAIGLMGIFLVILFPTGHLPTRRARIIARAGAIAIVLGSASILFSAGPMDDSSAPAGVVNPIGIHFLQPILDPLRLIVILIPLCIVGAAAVLVGRLRRSTGVERLQLKWFAYAAALVALTYLVAMACSIPYSIAGHSQPGWVGLIQEIAIFSFVLIPIAIGISVLRYRLYDIDVVISKTVVFGALAAFITVVYVAIVVGIGSLFGSGDRANPALAIAATVIVALAFQPVRDRVHRFANRLVYGERATPYEIMSDLGHRMAETIDIGRALPEMAEVAATGIRAQTAKVDLRLPTGDTRSVVWPADAALPQEWTRTVEVRYRDEAIGEISDPQSGRRSDPSRRVGAAGRPRLAGRARHAQRAPDRRPPAPSGRARASGRRPGGVAPASRDGTRYAAQAARARDQRRAAPGPRDHRCPAGGAGRRHDTRQRTDRAGTGGPGGRRERGARLPARPRARDLPAAPG